jgi:hypothetical protein
MTASSSNGKATPASSSEYQLSARLVYPSVANSISNTYIEVNPNPNPNPNQTQQRPYPQMNNTSRPSITDITSDLFNKFERNTFLQTQAAANQRPTITEASYTGNVKIHEVNKDGYFIRLLNVSNSLDEDLSNYTLQQVVSTMPVAVYRLGANVKLPPGHTLTVWSRTDQVQEQPPHTFVWKEQDKFGTGPECTTILTKPNGQAISWTTGSHRYGTVSLKDYDEIVPVYAQKRSKTAHTPLTRQKLSHERVFTPTKHPHGTTTSNFDMSTMSESSAYTNNGSQRNFFSNQKARPINSAQSRNSKGVIQIYTFNF